MLAAGGTGSPRDYWITRSARTRMDCGMVRPRAFAVFRLMANSSRVTCCTGRSAGFAPLRSLSTYWAAVLPDAWKLMTFHKDFTAVVFPAKLGIKAPKDLEGKSIAMAAGSS